MTRRFWLAVLALAGSLALQLPAATAKIGTGVGADPISLAVPARAGGSYDLPPLWVVNTGDEDGVYRVAVEVGAAGTGRAVPRSWVSVRSDNFELAPGTGRWVPLALHVPRTAAAGRYRGMIVAGTVRENVGGSGIGAAAATHMEFTVAGPAATKAAGDAPPTGTGAAAVATVVAIAAALRHRRRGRRIVTPS